MQSNREICHKYSAEYPAFSKAQIADSGEDAFCTDWLSFGLTRIDEWVSHQSTLRALLDDKWRGTEYLDHWTGEGGKIL